MKTNNSRIRYYLLGSYMYERTDKGLVLNDFGKEVYRNAQTYLEVLHLSDGCAVEVIQLRDLDQSFATFEGLIKYRLSSLQEADAVALIYHSKILSKTLEYKVARSLGLPVRILPVTILCSDQQHNNFIENTVRSWYSTIIEELSVDLNKLQSSDGSTRVYALTTIEVILQDSLQDLYLTLKKSQLSDLYLATYTHFLTDTLFEAPPQNKIRDTVKDMILDTWLEG